MRHQDVLSRQQDAHPRRLRHTTSQYIRGILRAVGWILALVAHKGTHSRYHRKRAGP
jgi:hypothetical protein